MTAILQEDPGYMEELTAIFKRQGEAAAREYGTAPDSPEGMFNALHDYILEGMPCDRVNEVVSANDNEFVWVATTCLHKPYWEQVKGDVKNFYTLREAWVKAFIEKLNPSFIYERTGNRHEIKVKGGAGILVSNVLNNMIEYFGRDVKRVNHALKVYGYAKTISGKEKISDRPRLIVELAAILHDIGIKEAERKYNSSAGKYQETEGPPIAEKILSSEGVEKSIVERVCYIVGNHHSYNKIDDVDFQILVEADFLVNIDEEALDPDAVKTIKEKYFKTTTGQRILESLFNV